MDFETLQADLNFEPITGYLASDHRPINLPLISHIVDNLYVGGHSERADLGDFFSHVFSLYVWGTEYRSDKTTTRHRSVRMLDSATEDTSLVDEIVPEIVEALEAGGNVLIHCQAGINRSNLTAALVLREWKGLTSAEAIAMLRERRGDIVLANPGFEKFLLSLDNPEPHTDYPGDGGI